MSQDGSEISWAKLLRSKIFYVSASLLLLGAAMDNISSAFIPQLFPDRAPIPDTLFTLLPYWQWTQSFSDIANVFSCLLLALYLFPQRPARLSPVLAVLGFGYVLRSIIILLNPIGGPLGNGVHYGLTTIHQYGQFPSGHMFLVVAIYYLIDVPILKKLALISVLVEVLALLLSHGHYSIDIIGGFLIAYFAYHFISKKFEDGQLRKAF